MLRHPIPAHPFFLGTNFGGTGVKSASENFEGMYTYAEDDLLTFKSLSSTLSEGLDLELKSITRL